METRARTSYSLRNKAVPFRSEKRVEICRIFPINHPGQIRYIAPNDNLY